MTTAVLCDHHSTRLCRSIRSSASGSGSNCSFPSDSHANHHQFYFCSKYRSSCRRRVGARNKQMCVTDLDCRRLAPAWKKVTTVLNNVLSFDCCVVPPEAMASHAQELDEIVDTLLPLFAGQDRLELVSIKRMRLPRKFGGFVVAPMSLRSPMAFPAQYLALAPLEGPRWL